MLLLIAAMLFAGASAFAVGYRCGKDATDMRWCEAFARAYDNHLAGRPWAGELRGLLRLPRLR